MYNPAHFAETRPGFPGESIARYPLATLITTGQGGLDANHIPMIWVPGGEHGILRGHVARANPVWKDASTEALAVFHGPQHYISPSWYPSKREHGKVVPTWNYAVVHAHGTVRFPEDPDWLLATVTALTDAAERINPDPWRVTDAPQDYIAGLLRAIAGVELTITRIEAKWKASQNRSPADREGVAAALRELGADAAAIVSPST
ncbi:MAG: FMN-binding negative transcriptional regulator [Acidobacteria bacterium]|nr:FMN-binding negative transcriptional regulator [Acidobacteriota bacterium]